jgi:glycosyltransferase involved in cell wall biosynthesis
LTPLPVVSVVVPMYQEAGYIEPCLESFSKQTYPLDRLEVLVVDGGSTDGSRQTVERWAEDHEWVRVLDNAKRVIPAACNVGLFHARGDVVCFFSSHGEAAADFIERVVAVLHETGATGVGGTYLHVGGDPVSRAIGKAMSSPFGMASPHRFANTRCSVDTISHPAYWRKAVLDVGGFDEGMLRNEDYDLNWRLRERGAELVFDPSIRSVYRPRASLGAAGRQFWWYGWWKGQMALRHPRSLKARHLAPPAFAAGVLAAPVLLATRRGRRLVAAGAFAYATAVAAAVSTIDDPHADKRVAAATFPLIHLTWGAGLLASLASRLFRRSAT